MLFSSGQLVALADHPTGLKISPENVAALRGPCGSLWTLHLLGSVRAMHGMCRTGEPPRGLLDHANGGRWRGGSGQGSAQREWNLCGRNGAAGARAPLASGFCRNGESIEPRIASRHALACSQLQLQLQETCYARCRRGRSSALQRRDELRLPASSQRTCTSTVLALPIAFQAPVAILSCRAAAIPTRVNIHLALIAHGGVCSPRLEL